MYLIRSHNQNLKQRHYIIVGSKSFENVLKLKYLSKTEISFMIKLKECIQKMLIIDLESCFFSHPPSKILRCYTLTHTHMHILILSFVLCGCEVWSHLRKQHKS
jgi:hypothetical protein